MSGRDKYSPSRSSDDDDYSRDRKSRSDRDRSRRRSRSRSRDRRSRSRSSSRSSESKYRFRPRAPREEDWRVAPCETILLKGLPEHIRDADLYNLFTETNASPIDIRLVIRKGQRTSFAFVEFRNTSEAAEWMKRQQGMVKIDKDNTAICVYSRRSAPYTGNSNERQPHRSGGGYQQIDWTCPNTSCGFTNFRKRYSCYLCNTPRSQNSSNTQQNSQKTDDGSSQLGVNPCNTVLLRGLDALTDENHVLLALARITSLAPKNCYVMRDSTTGSSSGYGFMEFNSVMDGKRIKDHFSQTPFEIDGKLIMVDYAKNTYSTILASLQYAQQSQQVTTTHRMTEYEQQALSANSGSIAASQQYPEPDMSALQYEPVSGMYYDPVTTFYYDSNSQYFYNGQTQQYMYWDSVNKTYVPVDNPSSTQHQQNQQPQQNNNEKSNTSEKEKAKNIAKEMAKWAKSQNKKNKPAAVVQQTNNSQQKEESVTGLPKDMAYDVLMGNKKLAASKTETTPMINSTNNAHVMSSLVAQYDAESDEESDLLNPNKHISKQELTCLLCERKFNSLAILEKHVAISDLHKQNLAKRLQQAKTNNNQKQYRDRAQERRIQTNTVFAKEGGTGLFSN